VPHSDHLTPGSHGSVVQDAGWAPGSVWTGWGRVSLLLPAGFEPRTVKPLASRC
jgi:hypothetical protein